MIYSSPLVLQGGDDLIEKFGMQHKRYHIHQGHSCDEESRRMNTPDERTINFDTSIFLEGDKYTNSPKTVGLFFGATISTLLCSPIFYGSEIPLASANKNIKIDNKTNNIPLEITLKIMIVFFLF
jgi:hypothetical protein